MRLGKGSEMCISEGQGSRGKPTPAGSKQGGQVKIMLNGKEREIARDATVLDILNELDIKSIGIAIELNLEIVSKSKFAETVLKDGDKVEIVRMVGGG